MRFSVQLPRNKRINRSFQTFSPDVKVYVYALGLHPNLRRVLGHFSTGDGATVDVTEFTLPGFYPNDIYARKMFWYHKKAQRRQVS